jgi:hypothetical protein
LRSAAADPFFSAPVSADIQPAMSSKTTLAQEVNAKPHPHQAPRPAAAACDWLSTRPLAEASRMPA